MTTLSKPERLRLLETARACFAAGNTALAGEIARQITAVMPHDAAANELLAYVAGRAGDAVQAHQLLERACVRPDASPEAHYYLGKSWLTQGNHRAAITGFQRALAKGGAFFEALCDLGTAQARSGDTAGALQSYRQAERLRPDSPELLFNLGALHDERGEYALAAACYARCLALRPDHVAAWSNRGAALHLLGRQDEALEHFDRALALQPDNAAAWSNRALALSDQQRLAEARAAYDRALQLAPDSAGTRWNRAQTDLLAGDYATGWQHYEARWDRPGAEPRRHQDLPALTDWNAARGERVLVWAEQGYGDNIQFGRYVPLLLAAGAEVVLEMPAPLQPLLAGQLGCPVITRDQPRPAECTRQIALASLPGLHGTTPATIPPPVPLLRPDPARLELWGGRLPATTGLRIGLACSGNAAVDRLQGQRRPIALEALATALHAVPAAALVLIQKDLRPADAAWLQRHRDVWAPGPQIHDFADSAALVAAVDVVVSIDTSLAHLAGAMGKPVIVLLTHTPDWRWGLGRADSPWYPTVHLLRQAQAGDWASVLAQLPAALAAVADTLPTTGTPS